MSKEDSETQNLLKEDPQKSAADRFAEENSITWVGELKATGVIVLAVLLLCGGIFIATYFFAPQGPNSGFDARLQNIFLGYLSPQRCSKNLEEITKQIHMAGTPEGSNLTDVITRHFRDYLGEFGKITRETYEVRLAYPTVLTTVTVTRTSNQEPLYTAPLFEDEIKEDPQTKSNTLEMARAFNAYSINGRASTDRVYYVNYGRVEDFEKLSGINLVGAIVIARYGKIYRGLKAQNAQDKGCAGILIYSDPFDDGKSRGEVYPNGPYRPVSSYQRGSSMFINVQPGDPTTPNGPSTPGTRERIKREDATNIPQKILVQPISARDASAILKRLGGAKVPEDWVGALPEVETYKFGGEGNSDSTVTMNIQNKEDFRLIHNVFATIPGQVEFDRHVIIGNHRDAWQFGSVDPATGTIAQLELARSLGNLMRTTRFRPRRTLVFASWDAEEYGLIGSTEWVEHHREILREQLVAYLNVDNNPGRLFSASSSPSLSNVIREETEKLQSPIRNNETLRESWNGETYYVGSGSDDSPFFHHLGVSTISMSFTNDLGVPGVYHSLYETFKYQQTQVDKDNTICVTSAGILGLVAVRLFNDEVLPFNHTEQATKIRQFYGDLLTSPLVRDYNNSLLEPQKSQFIIAFNTLGDSLVSLLEKTREVHDKLSILKTQSSQAKNYGVNLRHWNDKAMKIERLFTSPKGLFGRSWYKHLIVAPGKRTGYAYDIFPSIIDSITEKNFDNVMRATEQLRDVLNEGTRYLS